MSNLYWGLFNQEVIAVHVADIAHVDVTLARRAVIEFFEFFIPAKKRWKDWDGTEMSASPLIEIVWAHVLLDTEKYQALCGGNFIHYLPANNDDDDCEAKRRRYYSTLHWRNISTAGCRPDPEIWPPLDEVFPVDNVNKDAVVD